MSAAIASTSNALARGAPSSSCSQASANRPPTGDASRRRSPPSTTVCAYDRAGHGRSDDVAAPQDGIALATDLHTLLERAGVPGPYVLVGHSSGGPYVRVFAARYPDQVAGMVLLDAQPADAFTALPDYPGFYPILRTVYSLSHRRWPASASLGPSSDCPPTSPPAAARGARDEYRARLPTALAAGARRSRASATDRSSSSRPDPDSTAGWLEAQDQLPGLSTNSVHRVLPTATHNSLISGVDAKASSQAILDVVPRSGPGRPVR